MARLKCDRGLAYVIDGVGAKDTMLPPQCKRDRASSEEYTPFRGVDEDGGNMRRHRARWEGFSNHVTLPRRQWLGR